MIYHVGLIIERTGTAFFQLRRNVDFLSCEIYAYYGERETTKSGFIERLRKNHQQAEQDLKIQYPGKVKRLGLTIK